MNNEIAVRKGTPADLPKIIALVKQLAIYEKEPNAVTATLFDYEQAFNQGLIGTLVAEDTKKEIIGMTLFYDTFSTWKGKMLYLEDFIVLEPFRRTGIGRSLFNATIEEAKSRKCKLIKWQVLDWNKPAIRFYEKCGATIEKNWWNGKITFTGRI